MLNREKTINSINNVAEHFEIKFQELPYVNKINLRIDPNNSNYMSSCCKILGTILPTKANTYVKNEKLKIIWLGPDEWLIVSDDDMVFQDGFYQAISSYEDYFDVLCPRILNPDGTRFWDWSIKNSNEHRLIEYNEIHKDQV